jgi:hypothetical protein
VAQPLHTSAKVMLMPAMIVCFIQGSRTTNQKVAANGKYNISPSG